MGYKLKTIIQKNKANLIIYLMLWLLFTVALVVSVSHSITNATLNNSSVITEMFTVYNDFGKTLSETFMPAYIGQFFKTLAIFTIIFLTLVIISILKNKDKNEYKDIEHGSSDWCEGGEQYRILSDKKGIILAQNNYLPLDKRGNINVLIVGRFRFW